MVFILLCCLLSSLFASLSHENVLQVLDQGHLGEVVEAMKKPPFEFAGPVMVHLAKARNFKTIETIFLKSLNWHDLVNGLVALYHSDPNLVIKVIVSTPVKLDDKLVLWMFKKEPKIIDQRLFLFLFSFVQSRESLVDEIIDEFYSRYDSEGDIFPTLTKISLIKPGLGRMAIRRAFVRGAMASDEKMLSYAHHPLIDAGVFAIALVKAAKSSSSVESFEKLVGLAEREDFLALENTLIFEHPDKETAFMRRFDKVIGYMSPPGTLYPTRHDQYDELIGSLRYCLSTNETFPDALIQVILEYHCIESTSP